MSVMSITNVSLLALATNPFYFTTLQATNQTQPAISLLSYSSQFQEQIIQPNATARLLQNTSTYQPFHEGGVYNAAQNALYVASNYENLQDNVNMTVISFANGSTSAVSNITETQFPDLYEANGGTTYYPPGSNISSPPEYQVWCDEGDLSHPSALVSVQPASNQSQVILNNYLGGHNFSSLNDVRQHPVTGDLWFTDAAYGYFQGFRPPPDIPQMVYRFEPATGNLQVVADGFVQPNGLEFSPDLKTLYVTDTGATEFNLNSTRPATIYTFNVSSDNRSVSNRRTFAYIANGFPDGIHADTEGNVWAGCGDGVHVWNPEGRLVGKVFIGETSNNFAFGPDLGDGRGAVLWMFSNHGLWEVRGLKVTGREVCKDWFGLASCGIVGASAPPSS